MSPADLRAAKARLGCTRARMAARLGITDAALKHYLDGTRGIPARVADGVTALLARRERELALRAEADTLAL